MTSVKCDRVLCPGGNVYTPGSLITVLLMLWRFLSVYFLACWPKILVCGSGTLCSGSIWYALIHLETEAWLQPTCAAICLYDRWTPESSINLFSDSRAETGYKDNMELWSNSSSTRWLLCLGNLSLWDSWHVTGTLEMFTGHSGHKDNMELCSNSRTTRWLLTSDS